MGARLPTGGLSFFWDTFLRYALYVDGFNLYNRLLKRHPHCKWLDLRELFRNLNLSGDLTHIRYFTSIVLNNERDPSVAERQAMYLRALQTTPRLKIYYGQFMLRPVVGEQIDFKTGKSLGNNARIQKYSEKGSDVNLASFMIRDAAKDEYDTAVVITNDSDLVMAFRIVKLDFKKKVILVSPGQKFSNHLSGYASEKIKLTSEILMKSQFDENLKDKNGTFSRPFTWGTEYRQGKN